MKKRRKFSLQKTFSTVSASFIFACCIFYGYRFVSLYLENEKSLEVEDNTLATVIKNNNKDDETFNNINGVSYFNGKVDDNYVSYSNLLWRIVKVDNDNTIKLISEDIISYLAFDDSIDNFENSYVSNWLNKDVLINQIDTQNMVSDKICTDKVSKANNSECNNYIENLNIGLLSVADYVNAGAEDSYLNNSKFYYLSSINENEIWYVNSKGKLTNGEGNKLYGIRPTITLKGNINYSDGNGSIDNPYIVNSDTYFGSYVKLGNDIWRIYNVDGSNIKLSLNKHLEVNNTKVERSYSNKDYYYNDTVEGSLAYYLNNNYLNSLDYKDKIIYSNWSNGLVDNTFNYKDTLDTTIDSKVAMLSYGNVILNDELSDYFLMSGNEFDDSMIYEVKENGALNTIKVTNNANVVPTITLSKDLLTKGNGTINEPYELEG